MFTITEQNPDPGAGILYCLRYRKRRIYYHQRSVVKALRSLGVGLEVLLGEIVVKPSRILDESEQRRLGSLLEELSCLNEARTYSAAGFSKFHSIRDLKKGLISTYSALIEYQRIRQAYDVIHKVIPQLVRELRTANHQNKVLSPSERKDLSELLQFAQNQELSFEAEFQYY